jgi:hypothetical protein
MKRIIVSSKQAKRLTEENNVNVSVDSTGNTIPAAINAVTAAKPKITNASKIGDPIIHVSNPSSTNGSNDSEITQHVEVSAGQTPEQAMQQQLNPAATNGGDIEISGEGISEGIRTTKGQLEQFRLRVIKENGTVYTKKQLEESFKK